VTPVLTVHQVIMSDNGDDQVIVDHYRLITVLCYSLIMPECLPDTFKILRLMVITIIK
jgi:hypothetical protein